MSIDWDAVEQETAKKYKDYAPYEVLYNDYMSYSEILKLKDIEEILSVHSGFTYPNLIANTFKNIYYIYQSNNISF